mgnify:FL=1
MSMYSASDSQTASLAGLPEETRRIAEAGLCRTCIHVQDCTLLAHATTPVIECEQFEIVAPSRQVNPEISPHAYDEEPDRRFFGLCMTCENRNTCVFAKRNGGGWHCEEYA